MSLRMRLIVSFSLVVVLCLSITAVTLTAVFQSSRDKLATERLNDMARPIFVQVTTLAREQKPRGDILTTLQEQARENDVYILLTSDDGKILAQLSPERTPEPIKLVIPPEELPQNVAISTQGTFVTENGQSFLYSAFSVRRLFNYQIQSKFDTMILAVPRGKPIAIMAGLLIPFIWAGLITLVISIGIAVLLANSFYRPIRQVTEAVDVIADGQYDYEVPVTGPREIKGIATHFNEMMVRVTESQQQLRHFVADVSHQLRTPLTSIQGFAQAILDGTAEDSETKLKAARVIDDEAKRMIRQVEELLELSRIQSGQLQMNRELVDVKELLLHCQEVFSLRSEEKSIHLRTEIEPLMPIFGDSDRLEQVFSNLLDNALKNTPVKGEVAITGRNSAANSIEITVSDNGPGIPPEQLRYVFERFYQASGLRAGFGLGLAIAKEIVTAHGGRIEAYSSPGEETKFVIKLPASISGSTL
ncbi:sensor histidine kinase [Chloroflexota bacterium]